MRMPKQILSSNKPKWWIRNQLKHSVKANLKNIPLSYLFYKPSVFKPNLSN